MLRKIVRHAGHLSTTLRIHPDPARFELRYLRDKHQREADFVVVRDRKPWFLIEVKHSETKLSPTLAYYQNQLKTPQAFQAVVELPYEQADRFTVQTPIVVPARTLLAQLV